MIKCRCGFEETKDEYIKTDVLFVRGPKKGTHKEMRTEYVRGVAMDTYTVPTKTSVGQYYNVRHNVDIDIKVCPDCSLVYMDGWY